MIQIDMGVIDAADRDAGPIRDEVTSVLASYGGKLVEYPYYYDPKYARIDSMIYPEIAGGSPDDAKTDLL